MNKLEYPPTGCNFMKEQGVGVGGRFIELFWQPSKHKRDGKKLIQDFEIVCKLETFSAMKR